MPIKAVGERVVHFKDIAEVRRTYKDAESVARLNGKSALAIEVIQRSRANVIDTIAEVNAILDEERSYWPAGIEIVASRDKSKDVNDMLSELQNSVLAAVLLVFVVIIGILGIRSALLVGVAIPGSFLMGILLIGSFGVTINMMVLFALIMAVGMLVDGAIVVTEMADRRLAEGESRHDAYSRAAVRMSLPIIAYHCIDGYHARRIRPARPMAGHIGRIHEVPADNADRRLVRIVDHGAALRSHAWGNLRPHGRQYRRGPAQSCSRGNGRS